jgi:hypothetical protein
MKAKYRAWSEGKTRISLRKPASSLLALLAKALIRSGTNSITRTDRRGIRLRLVQLA